MRDTASRGLVVARWHGRRALFSPLVLVHITLLSLHILLYIFYSTAIPIPVPSPHQKAWSHTWVF